MSKIDKIINDVTFHFDITTEIVSKNNLVVNVKVINHQETLFSKVGFNSDTLKSIAIDAAKTIKESYRLKINNYDSGIEWQGQFE